LTTDRRGAGPFHIRKQPIQIGYISGENVLLTAGIDAASQVITAGSAYLTEGDLVTVK
jgi:hypothetical protein